MPRTLPRALRACSVPAMDLDLVGRRAAVMASSDGIGKAIACALAREGVHVMMCGRDDAKLAAAMDEAKAIAREGAQVAGERIDLGTRAGPGRCSSSPPRPRSAASTSSSRTRAGRPPVRCSRSTTRPGRRPSSRCCSRSRAARAPRCRTSRPPTQGRIISIASSSIKATLPTLGFSNVFRPGIHGLVKTLAEELGPKGITVNLIAPGKIDTARVRWLDDTRAERTGTSADEVRAASEREIPLGRYGEPDGARRGRGVPLLEGRALRLRHGDAGRRRPRASALTGAARNAARPRPAAHRRALHDLVGARGADRARAGRAMRAAAIRSCSASSAWPSSCPALLFALPAGHAADHRDRRFVTAFGLGDHRPRGDRHRRSTRPAATSASGRSTASRSSSASGQSYASPGLRADARSQRARPRSCRA